MAERLTDRMVKGLPAPISGNRIIYDTEVKGLGVRVTAAGAKALVLNYRIGGRERRYTIGGFPEWSVAAAREEAKRLKAEIDLGRDPMGERHADRAAPTMEDLARRYLEDHASRKRASSQRDDRAMIATIILPALGKLKVPDVRHRDVEALHRDVTKRAPYRANRAVALLSKMFSLAVKWEMRPDNPAKGVERNPEDRRTRYLSPDELGRLTKVLQDYPNQIVANAIRLLLLTGARRGEVLSAKWVQFDLEAGIWVKPSASTKQAKEHRVPLSAPALQLLREMRAGAEGEYVFPGRTGERLVSLNKVWERICRNADLKGVRLHDLRHTYASILASAGLSLPIIGQLLGHTQAATTHRYSHLFDDPLRAATECVGALFETVSGRTERREVVPIRKDK